MSDHFTWSGRHDGDEIIHRRFFQNVTEIHQTPTDFGLIGFCCDEGVRRNKGRTGANIAPNIIRGQLANYPIHQAFSIQDKGNVSCTDGDLEQAQKNLGQAVCELLDQNTTPIVLGGGHETAFGSFQGIFQHVMNNNPQQNIGIINFDAHFDLRNADVPTSGTPFLNSANLLKENGKDFNYLCLGIAKHGNTKVLFDTAKALNAQFIEDKDLIRGDAENTSKIIQDFINKVDVIYITIDLDVFSSYIAPGVSAPAVRGISLNIFEELFTQIVDSGKVKLLDIVEYNPEFDQDNRTSKLAAFIVYQFIQNIIGKKESV